MSIVLRVVLIVVSVLVAMEVLYKIRKSQMDISDSIYWIVCSVGLVVLSVFSRIASFFSQLIGIESPSNFVFLVAIFMVLVKLFSLSLQMSQQKHRLRLLIEEVALRQKAQEDKESSKDFVSDQNNNTLSAERTGQ